MLRDYVELMRLDKPIGTLLLLWPTLWALLIAANGHPPILVTVVFIAGVFLTRAAGCVINDYADRNFDGKVERTKYRPLARGAISAKVAVLVCVILSAAAFILALLFLRPTTIMLALPALCIYLSYPYMKRFFFLPQAYLGIAFSFGVLMAFIEILGEIPQVGYLLFLANWCWIFGYDTIYALVDIEDDKKIGIYTSAITLGGFVTLGVLISYIGFCGLLVMVGLLLHFGYIYWIGLFVGSSLLLFQCWTLYRGLDNLYFKMFLLNNKVGYIIFFALLLNYALAT